MPIVEIKLWAGRTEQQKGEIIRTMTESLASTLAIERERVWVIITDVPKENWGKGGTQSSRV